MRIRFPRAVNVYGDDLFFRGSAVGVLLRVCGRGIELRLGSEGKPGKGEIIPVRNSVELRALKGSVYGRSGHGPGASGLGVSKLTVFRIREGQDTIPYVPIKYAGGSVFFRLTDATS